MVVIFVTWPGLKKVYRYLPCHTSHDKRVDPKHLRSRHAARLMRFLVLRLLYIHT